MVNRIFFKIYNYSFLTLVAFAQTAFAQQSNDEKNLSSLQSKQIVSQMTEVEQKNKYGQAHYAGVAIKMAVEAAEKFAHGGECAASCPEGCCDAGAGLVYEGGMFMLLNTQATMQSKEHQMIATESCNVRNRYANTYRDCSKETKGIDLTKPESSWYDDQGKCKSTSPAECKLISFIPGASVFTSKQVNCKKNASNPCGIDFYSAYKSNPDGSITIRMSNKLVRLTMDSFKNKDALIAAGIPYAQAETLLARFNETSKKSFPNGKAAYVAVNRAQLKEELNKGINPVAGFEEPSRQPATYTEAVQAVTQDGLTKNFNGELIHAKGSNIFEVMSKRYQKTTDSLLSD
ncbi:hypothetical protein K2P97_02300 [bacterium]|nr:hypothetical protein [bacterium]